MAGLGSEVLIVLSGGLDTSGHIETNPVYVTAERVARRWLTVPGTAPWAPNMGAGLFALVNHDMTRGDLGRLEMKARSEALRETGVTSARIKATNSQGLTKLTGRITIASGETYTLIVGADRASEVLL